MRRWRERLAAWRNSKRKTMCVYLATSHDFPATWGQGRCWLKLSNLTSDVPVRGATGNGAHKGRHALDNDCHVVRRRLQRSGSKQHKRASDLGGDRRLYHLPRCLKTGSSDQASAAPAAVVRHPVGQQGHRQGFRQPGEIVQWLITLNQMKASDVLDEEQTK